MLAFMADREKLIALLRIAENNPDGLPFDLMDYAQSMRRSIYHSMDVGAIVFDDTEIESENKAANGRSVIVPINISRKE